jgi:hypothetical protein
MPTSPPNRLGVHYFPDSLHYRPADLKAWLPQLRALGAAWITLLAPPEQAIPQEFLAGLLEAGIQPVLHFPFSEQSAPSPGRLANLLDAYAGWGVRYACLFDRPNQRQAWPTPAWAQADLVERFLDGYLPYLEILQQTGLTPVFPPLAPGGDYWDTAFLRSALEALQRRVGEAALQDLVLGAYAWIGDHPLSWGAGGPERWPGARPYHTPPGEQDQRGFRIFEWYQAISEAALGWRLPVILLRAGCRPQPPESARQSKTLLELARLVAGRAETNSSSPLALPETLLAVNFWLLAAAPGSRQAAAWYRPDGSLHPAAAEIRELRQNEVLKKAWPGQPGRPIAHYVLLPPPAAGDGLPPELLGLLLARLPATWGFSLSEAASAGRVTVLGGVSYYPESDLQALRRQGCRVVRIDASGTEIAHWIASLD